MPLRDALEDLRTFRSFRFDAPRQLATEAAANAIRPSTESVETRPPPDLDEIADRVRRALGTGVQPTSSDLLRAPWCIWDGKRPLAEEPALLDGYLRLVESLSRKSHFRRLAAAYAVRFPENSKALRPVAECLARLAPKFTGAWSAAHDSLRVFDAVEAPVRIASAAIVRRLSPSELLSDEGIGNLAAEAGLAEAAFAEGLRQIGAVEMEPGHRLDAVRSWCGQRKGGASFEKHRGLIADALVLPHAGKMPEKPVRDRMLSFLLGKFGDPRTREARWSPMNCTGVVKRWLIEQSLRQFLDVVDEIALERHWKYRRAFWTAVYNRNLISDACVIFDKVGEARARRMFDGGTPFSTWIRGGSKPIERGHSCLLLRIGNGLVAEWSHKGRCNIWHDALDPSAPELHAENYMSSDVMVPDSDRRWTRRAYNHVPPDGYSWQSKVADEIFALTNTRIMQSEYTVR
ncbi:EH signature domain-containing protein [Bradyrhizobium sp. RT11b]|uniref:EH signature domain-containing protein n=1 Tax=Bradyrhizobium sp. RT11b TaxID=3156332 RepID=UPI00339453F0